MRPSKKKGELDGLLLGLISIPPLALSVLEPESVPPFKVTRLRRRLTSPPPVRVPPVIERVLPIVDVAAIESVPPEIVSASSVRLLIESTTASE